MNNKVKALNLRLDVSTYMKLKKYMKAKNIGFQALGECLIQEWLLFIEENDTTMNFRRATNNAVSRFLSTRKTQTVVFK